MVRLSVNVNKVATLRNSRGGEQPRVLDAVRVILAAGAKGITVHPREDRRHIEPRDVDAIAEELAELRDSVELNIEGDPRAELLAMVRRVRPHQCTLVPVLPGEITSQAGWPAETPVEALEELVAELKERGVRVSMFVDPHPGPIEWAAELGADRVELYTEPYARAFERGREGAEMSFAAYARAAEHAHACGLGINAGHDLDRANLPLFSTLPHLDEVSIGHALMSRALFVGLGRATGEYLAIFREASGG